MVNWSSKQSTVCKINLREHDLSLVEIIFVNGRSMVAEIKDLEFHNFFEGMNVIAVKNKATRQVLKINLGHSSHFDLGFLYAISQPNVHKLQAVIK